MNIYTHPNETKAASEFIHDNIRTAYVGMKGNNTYYNVNGVVWQVWQSGTGNYPETTGIRIENFTF